MTKFALFATCFLTGLVLPSNAEQDDLDIRIRIHSPFHDIYEGEGDSWLIRIENHGTVSIPVPFGLSHPDDGSYPPPQFHVQTWDQASQGIKPEPSPWPELLKFGTGELVLQDGSLAMDPSMLEPGKTMESPSISPRSPTLRTPSEGGKFRTVMQVGPDDFVYSNWITKERIHTTPSGMRKILSAEPWNGIRAEIQISDETTPRYLWFKTIGTSNIILKRICEVPDRTEPIAELDKERGQFRVFFPPNENPDFYYGYNIGVTKRNPFPINYISKDFMLTSYPISTPSPIGFPTELFEDSLEDGGATGGGSLTKARGVSKPDNEPTDVAKGEDAEMPGRPWWILVLLFVTPILSLVIWRLTWKR